MPTAESPPECTGSCLCGKVCYQVTGPFGPMVHCHCSMCRKAHGSAFATFVGAPADGFRWLTGRDNVATYASTGQTRRYFCRTCGSVTPALAEEGEQVFVPAGNLAEDCGARPVAHMFTDSRAPWTVLDDALTRFDGAPPGYTAPAIDPPEYPAAEPGTLTGGCLCGAIRFELSGTPLMMVNCHCSRCRRGRSAAHATNLFVKPEQFRWLQGEAAVQVFDLPEAERFGINFCPACGGNVPRMSARIGRVNVPAGSLDGDPGMAPGYHIYVASRAPWFEISDDLPRFDEKAR